MSAMHHVMSDLKLSLESVKTTGDDFERIAGSVHHVSNRTEVLTGDIEALTLATEEVSDAMGTILALTEENAAGLETSAASIQETNATLESVTTAAAHLAHIAGDLHALTLEFQLDETVSDEHSVEEQEDVLSSEPDTSHSADDAYAVVASTELTEHDIETNDLEVETGHEEDPTPESSPSPTNP